jgi:hypothetical protein
MATTVVDLAGDLGVDAGDVEVLLEQLGEREAELHDELASFVRLVLDPYGERTALQSPDDGGSQAGAPHPVDRHDPTPVNIGVGGCPAMIRCGVGQWAHCPGTPEWAGTVGRGRRRYLVFRCAAHRGVVHGPRAMTDTDRAELAYRREQWAHAKAGRPFGRVRPVDPA